MQGGFARCYEFVCGQTKEVFAGKVVDKKSLVKMRRREKMQAEIQLHKSLCATMAEGEHIVKFHRFFEDEKNVYILLELCKNQTLADLLKRRQTLSELECRYYML